MTKMSMLTMPPSLRRIKYVSETYLTRLTAFASYNPTYPILILGFQIFHNLDRTWPCGYSKSFVFNARSEFDTTVKVFLVCKI